MAIVDTLIKGYDSVTQLNKDFEGFKIQGTSLALNYLGVPPGPSHIIANIAVSFDQCLRESVGELAKDTLADARDEDGFTWSDLFDAGQKAFTLVPKAIKEIIQEKLSFDDVKDVVPFIMEAAGLDVQKQALVNKLISIYETTDSLQSAFDGMSSLSEEDLKTLSTSVQTLGQSLGIYKGPVALQLAEGKKDT